MKLSKVLSVFAVVALFALTSCNKEDCYDCTHDDTTFEAYTLCEDEAGSQTALDLAISTATAAGYNCTKQ